MLAHLKMPENDHYCFTFCFVHPLPSQLCKAQLLLDRRESDPKQERLDPKQERLDPKQERLGPKQERLGPKQKYKNGKTSVDDCD